MSKNTKKHQLGEWIWILLHLHAATIGRAGDTSKILREISDKDLKGIIEQAESNV